MHLYYIEMKINILFKLKNIAFLGLSKKSLKRN